MLTFVRNLLFLTPSLPPREQRPRGSSGRSLAEARFGLACLLLAVTSLHVATHLWPEAPPTTRGTHRLVMLVESTSAELLAAEGEPLPQPEPYGRCASSPSLPGRGGSAPLESISPWALLCSPRTLSLAPKTGPPLGSSPLL